MVRQVLLCLANWLNLFIGVYSFQFDIYFKKILLNLKHSKFSYLQLWGRLMAEPQHTDLIKQNDCDT